MIKQVSQGRGSRPRRGVAADASAGARGSLTAVGGGPAERRQFELWRQANEGPRAMRLNGLQYALSRGAVGDTLSVSREGGEPRGAPIQRKITVGILKYDADQMATRLRGDAPESWVDDYLPLLTRLDAEDGRFVDLGGLRQHLENVRADPERYFSALGLPGSATGIYDALGPGEKWKEHIDSRHHALGEDVYVTGSHREDKKKDPYYNIAMMDADRFLRTTIGRKFTVEDYMLLHELATSEKDKPESLAFRMGTMELGVPQWNSPKEEVLEENLPPFEGEVELPPLIASVEDAGIGGREKVVLTDIAEAWKMAPKEAYPEAIDRVLQAYYARIGKTDDLDDKLNIITHLHKVLERLHPYGDANSRTNRLLLNRMLAEQGLPLSILRNPLEEHHSTHEDWKREIVRGQYYWATLVDKRRRERTRSGGSVETEWRGWEIAKKEQINLHAKGQSDYQANTRYALNYGVLASNAHKPSYVPTDSPVLSQYSKPIDPYVEKVVLKEAPKQDDLAEKQEVIEEILRLSEAMPREALMESKLSDLKVLLGFLGKQK